MAQFITLTRSVNSTNVLVNLDLVTRIHQGASGARLFFSGDSEDYIEVVETPAEVALMIAKS